MSDTGPALPPHRRLKTNFLILFSLEIQDDAIADNGDLQLADLSSPNCLQSPFEEPEPDFGDGGTDFDAVYESDDEDECKEALLGRA